MTNLINTDTLLAQMEEYYKRRAEEANMTGDRTICVTWNDAVTLIKSAPTVDAVPVIRCGVCLLKRICIMYRDAKNKDGFCAWGKRE